MPFKNANFKASSVFLTDNDEISVVVVHRFQKGTTDHHLCEGQATFPMGEADGIWREIRRLKQEYDAANPEP